MILPCLIFLTGCIRHAIAIQLDECNNALGMETGRIQDEQITASSSFDQESVGPHNARIRTERDGGAWCPKSQITQESDEWIEVDLGEEHVISSLETQGRFGGGLGKEYPPGYRLQYWRDSLNRWITFNDSNGKQVISANKNTFTPALRELYSPIVASKIRLLPWSQFQRTVCLRLELYGCVYKGPLSSYSIPQGVHISSADLRDTAYDGLYDRHSESLSNGLGLLYDGVIGQDRSMQDYQRWVGWKRSIHGSTVDLVLEMKRVVNLTALSLHCSNQFNKDVYVFANAHLFFSMDGVNYSNRIVDYTYLADDMFGPTSDDLDLDNIKRELELEGGAGAIPLTVVATDKNYKTETVAVFTLNELPPAYIILIVGVCILVAAVCAVIVAVLYGRQRRQHKEEIAAYAAAVYGGGFGTLPMTQSRTNGVKGHSLQRVKDMQVLLESNGTSQHTVIPSTSTFMMTVNNMENSLIEKLPPSSPPPKCPVPISPPPGYHSQSDESSEYAEPDTPHKCSAEIPLLPPPPSSSRRRPGVRTNQAHQSADNVHYDSTIPSCFHPSLSTKNFLQGVTGSTIYGYGMEDQACTSYSTGNDSIEEIPRNKLVFKEKLGEGEFGEVHLCYMELGRNRSTAVAVKMLRQEASSNAVQDFDKELHILSKLDDRNVVRLIGCCRGEQPCMIVEYVENGDLHHFLRASDRRNISQDKLLHMASQIASGMKYLESMKLVHRDLATRNCLVAEDMSIKIADFGMARSLYSSDYYHIDGNFVLPIRWMAWECILLGKFTSKTDMWAFGVTLWEMFTLAQCQPFSEMSDQEVIENIQNMYHTGHLAVYLPQPDHCPKEMYDLMQECWRRDENTRPTFRDISLFLQRKTLHTNSQ